MFHQTLFPFTTSMKLYIFSPNAEEAILGEKIFFFYLIWTSREAAPKTKTSNNLSFYILSAIFQYRWKSITLYTDIIYEIIKFSIREILKYITKTCQMLMVKIQNFFKE